MTETPKKLEWVKVRAACSLQNVFRELEEGVKSDAEDAQGFLPSSSPTRFDFHSYSTRTFGVTRGRSDIPGIPVGDAIDFTLDKDRIVVSARDNQSNTELFSATITLDNDGNCKLKVADDSLEQWQFRRMALERLFFG